MFTKDDILARLIAGEDAQNIAQEAADAINAAIEEHREIERAQREKAELERKKSAKKEDAKAAIKAFVDFYNSWYDDGSDMSDDELNSAADMVLSLFDDIDVKETNDGHRHSVKVTMKGGDRGKSRSDDDIISNFLSKL